MQTGWTVGAVLLAAGSVGPDVAVAQKKSAPRGVVTLTTGKWIVERSIDQMTDKVSCTGYHASSRLIQLAENAMHVRIRGGVQSISIRINDDPAKPLRLPTDIERELSAISMKGAEYAALSTSRRLRIQVLTHVSGLVNEDIDLDGITAAVAHIRAKCPVPTATVSGTVALPNAWRPSRCDDVVTKRMKEAGIVDDVVAAVCRN